MNTQQNGSMTKAFAMKLGHLNDFIKPANSTTETRQKIGNLNMAWVTNMTNLLANHYSASISTLKSQILALNLDSTLLQELVNQTIQRARRNFGRKLQTTTIKLFQKTLFEISMSHNPSKPTQNTPDIPRSRATQQNHAPQPDKTNTHSGVRFAKGPHDPLSNFYQCTFWHNGMCFRSVEHAYQIEKALFHGFHNLLEPIRACDTAAQVKSIGRKIPSSGRWNSIKSRFMFDLLQKKWVQIPNFRNSLLAVQGRTILHPVPDLFWGTGNGDKKGLNVFGKLLQDTLDFQTKRRTSNPSRTQTQHDQNISQTKHASTCSNTPLSKPTHTTNAGQKQNIHTWSKASPSRHTHKPTTKQPAQILTSNRFNPLSTTQLPSTSTSGSTSTLIPNLTPVSPWRTNTSTTSPVSEQDFPNLPSPSSNKTLSPKISVPSTRSSSGHNTSSVGSLPCAPIRVPNLLPTKPSITSTRSSSRPHTYTSIGSLSMAPIHSTPVTLKRSRSSPNSSPETSQPPRKRKNSVPPKRSRSYPINIQTHRNMSKANWKWPVINEDTLVIGDSNLGRINSLPSDKVQVECFSGAHFQNLTTMLKNTNHGRLTKKPTNIIVSIGINDRASDFVKTSSRNLRTMLGHLVTKFPDSKIHLAEINYSCKLDRDEQTNLESLNKLMTECVADRINVIQKLHATRFSTERDNIHWAGETANTMIRHWLTSLN